MAEVPTPTTKPKLASLCKELVGLLGLKQGSVEIHCHKGKPQALHVIKPIPGLEDDGLCGIIHDKSVKFDDEQTGPKAR